MMLNADADDVDDVGETAWVISYLKLLAYLSCSLDFMRLLICARISTQNATKNKYF